jgi:hypothetical protein
VSVVTALVCVAGSVSVLRRGCDVVCVRSGRLSSSRGRLSALLTSHRVKSHKNKCGLELAVFEAIRGCTRAPVESYRDEVEWRGQCAVFFLAVRAPHKLDLGVHLWPWRGLMEVVM